MTSTRAASMNAKDFFNCICPSWTSRPFFETMPVAIPS
jgi:hypothetical protein